MFVGILLLVMGVLLVLEKMHVIMHGSVWDYLLPVALIALGIDFVFKHKKKQS
jgi:uncharacterized membrane protein HdeD (DUF308 family)